MSKSAMRKYILLVLLAAVTPIMLGYDCLTNVRCDSDGAGGIQKYFDSNNVNILTVANQEANADILVIGDSVMAAGHGDCIDTGGENCHKGIGDDTSMILVGGYGWTMETPLPDPLPPGYKNGWVRTEANPGAGITEEGELPRTIPDAYCMATRGEDSEWHPGEWQCCLDHDDNPETPLICDPPPPVLTPYDWVILNGGGNDMFENHPEVVGEDCGDVYAQEVYDLFMDVVDLFSYIYLESNGPKIIVLGPYELPVNAVGNADWYNSCVQNINAFAALLQWPNGTWWLQPEDWAISTTYMNDPSYYIFDGLHPSHYTIGLISAVMADIINNN